MSLSGTIITVFLLALAFGTQLFSPVVNSRLTGVGFYKLGNSIVLASLIMGVASLVYLMGQPIDQADWIAIGILIVTNICTYAFHRDRKTLIMWILYGIQIITFIYLVFHLFAATPQWSLFFFYCAGLLGIANFGMILGHYYLVVPKLTEEPLIYCLNIFWAILFLRLMSSLTVLTTTAVPYLEEGSVIGEGYTFNWLFISMRYLWGYVAPLILSFFIFRLCRLRSIQSATGVLYIMEFFVIVGELISIFLMAKHGLSL